MNSKTIRYIALLRGINVGGHVVKMEKLREFFKELGLENVRSYIQTGNVFFESKEMDKRVLRSKIEKHLEKALGYHAAVCLRTIEELEQLLELDPFKGILLTPDIRFSVTFLAEPVQEKLPVPYITPDGAYKLVDMTLSELFVVWHLKNGRPGNSYGLMEKKIKVEATTRFWHTTAKILSAAQQNK